MDNLYRLTITYTGSRNMLKVFDFVATDDDDARQQAQVILSGYTGYVAHSLYIIGNEIEMDLNVGTETIAQFIGRPTGSSSNNGESNLNFMARTCYLVKAGYDFAGNGADDITSVTNINKLQRVGDYQAMWDMMDATVSTAGGVGNLSAEEQVIANDWLIMDDKKIKKLTNARRFRVDRVYALMSNELSRLQVEEFMDETSSDELMTKYIEDSRKGTNEGNPVGITDYANGTDTYVGIGLVDKAWTPSSMTISQLSDKVTSILVYGDK